MTKKDYELIAKSIKSSQESLLFSPFVMKQEREIISYSIRNLAEKLSLELMSQNPRFDQTKFLLSCGTVL